MPQPLKHLSGELYQSSIPLFLYNRRPQRGRFARCETILNLYKTPFSPTNITANIKPALLV